MKRIEKPSNAINRFWPIHKHSSRVELDDFIWSLEINITKTNALVIVLQCLINPLNLLVAEIQYSMCYFHLTQKWSCAGCSVILVKTSREWADEINKICHSDVVLKSIPFNYYYSIIHSAVSTQCREKWVHLSNNKPLCYQTWCFPLAFVSSELKVGNLKSYTKNYLNAE